MKWVKRIAISLGVAFYAVAGGALLLTHWQAFGFKALAIPTGSMRPTMPPGSMVISHRVSLSSLKVGDVITYLSPLRPGSSITHRIVKAYKIDGKVPAFVTKGDANPSPDPAIVGGQVIGKAVWHVKYVGYVMLWSKTWLGIAALIYLPALFIMIEEVKRLADYLKANQPYELYRYHVKKVASAWQKRLNLGLSALIALLFAASIIGPRVEALLSSNTVSLVNNVLTVTPINRCVGTTTNNNNVNVTNINNQTAVSGNASSSKNTNGSSTTTGNASNSNSTSTTITITNNC